jgi:hypothetical protein
MMFRACILIWLALVGVAPAAAQIVTSSEISDVSVSIYRDPNRAAGAMDRRWPGGYAFISETRTIHIPAGNSVIRFEGRRVAAGNRDCHRIAEGRAREEPRCASHLPGRFD